MTAHLQVPLSLPLGDVRGNKTLRLIPPQTRSDCEHGIRPCPHVACKHHIVGCIANLTDEDAAVDAMERRLEAGVTATCALDIAEDGEHTTEQVAEFMGITPERVQQICDEAGHYSRKFSYRERAEVRDLLRTAEVTRDK